MPRRPKHETPKFSLSQGFPYFEDNSLEPTLREWLVDQSDYNPRIFLTDGKIISKYSLVLKIEDFFARLNGLLKDKYNYGIRNESLLCHFDIRSFNQAYKESNFPVGKSLNEFMYSVVLSLHFSPECQKRFRETGVLRYDLTQMECILIEVARMNAECNTAVVNVMSEERMEISN